MKLKFNSTSNSIALPIQLHFHFKSTFSSEAVTVATSIPTIYGMAEIPLRCSQSYNLVKAIEWVLKLQCAVIVYTITTIVSVPELPAPASVSVFGLDQVRNQPIRIFAFTVIV